MTKQERKEILEQMLYANEKMSHAHPNKAFDYADGLMKLCDSIEYGHAEILWKRSQAEDQLVAFQDSMKENESNLEKQIRENLENTALELYAASFDSLNYFLGPNTESDPTI